MSAETTTGDPVTPDPDNHLPPTVSVTIDGHTMSVSEGTTILDACGGSAMFGGDSDIPTLCYGPTIRPKNACRICMVEVEGSRTLVASCSREVADGMVIRTRSDRVDHSRKMVLEFLESSVDLSLVDLARGWAAEYHTNPSRYSQNDASPDNGSSDNGSSDNDTTGHDRVGTATMADLPVVDDNELYVRDYAKCILCYQCVDACGDAWQHSYVIDIAGRGFDSHVATEHEVSLPDSACVFCGNCIAVCPTGALMFSSEHQMRADGSWDESQQTVTSTICGYCGVGCNLDLHVQDNTIVKVMSPANSPITNGNLCIKGRFGYQHAQQRGESAPTDS